MKTRKILMYLALFSACLMLTLCAAAAPLEFNTDGDFETFSNGNNITEPKVENGVLSFSTTATDPQLYILNEYNYATKTGGVVNADKVKQIEIRFASTAPSGQFEIFFTSTNPEDGSYYCYPLSSGDKGDQSYAKNANYVFYSGTGSLDKFTTLTIDQSKKAYWKGMVGHLRIDPGKIADADFVIDYIRFIGEEEDDGEEDETTVKTEQILAEEKLYGECLFFDDFESYNFGDIPASVFYSKLGTTTLSKADACGEIKIVSGIGTNSGKAIELTGNNAVNKYPFIKVFYELDQKGQYTMIADMYSEPAGNFYFSLFNGYKGTGDQADKRIMVNKTGTKAKWTTVSSNYDTGNIDGFTNMTYFGFGANGVSDGEKLYIDNIRVYYRDCYDATVLGGTGATGTAPKMRFAPNSTTTFPENTFTRENYTFIGWSTSVNSNIYLPGDTMNIGDITSLTITANWKRTVTPEKTAQILEEEKLYGECLFFDDFENYIVNEVPTYVYYSKLGETSLYKADQCGEIRIVDGIGDNDTQVIELTGNGTQYRYPFIRVGYKLTEQGKYTMIADFYTDVAEIKFWCFFNGYSGTGPQTDKRINKGFTPFAKQWQNIFNQNYTTSVEGLTSINYFGFGGEGIANGQKMYIDNIRLYFKPGANAEFVAGDGATGTAPLLSFAYDDTITFPKNTFEKEGYMFAGWKTNLGDRIYYEGETLKLNNVEELTITATWAKFVPQLVRKNSIRDTDDGIQGMRFAGYVSNENKVYASEIGFIVTRAELLGDYQLTFGTNNGNGAGVSPDGVAYIYGATYDKAAGTDLIYSTSGDVFGSDIWKDVEGTFFTSVITGIPESAYKDKFVVRPYALIDGVYVYGEAMKRSVCDVAESAYSDGNRSDYVLNIIEKTGITPGKTVCFFGDSITHDGTFIKELAQTYLDTDKDTPRYEFYNCGIGGDTATAALKRLDSDLLYYDPDIVIMMFGMNDIGRNYYIKSQYNEEMEVKRQGNLRNYKTSMEAIIDRLLDEGIEVILCTPTPFDDTTTTTNESNVGLEACAEFVREIAKANNLQVIDHYANMYPLRSLTYWGGDSVHPNTLGQHVMAQSVMYSLGYIDEMELTTAMSKFDELNEQRHTVSTEYRMTLMVDYTLINSGCITVEDKKARAIVLRDSQDNAYWKGIYQDYIDNIDNIVEMREETVRLTEEMSYKNQ